MQFELLLDMLHVDGSNPVERVKDIKAKIMTLPAKTKVFPGHGLATTIGEERKYNPYIR